MKRSARSGKPTSSTAAFEDAALSASEETAKYVLRLYVAGATRQSARAIQTLRELCEDRLQGRYDLEVVDVYQQPRLARDDQIVALPTLIKRLPLPLRQLIGDLSNTERVLLGLDLKPKAHTDAKKAYAAPRKTRGR